MSPTRARRIALLTSGRQDWGILRSTCAAIRQRADLELRLLAGGMHLAERYGRTVELIREDGFEPADELRWLISRDGRDPDVEDQAGVALSEVGRALRRAMPEALVLAGDRFETAAAALAATVLRVPIVHLHGGEQTEGAFDDALRHAITKLAHLHLVSHEEHAARVAAMGEDPATIHVVGPPALDALFRDDLAARNELETVLGLALSPPVVVVTVHPATLEADPVAALAPVIAAMDSVPGTYVITLPNADPGSETIRASMLQAAARDPARRVAVEALGERRYWGLMRVADAMLGNSSSGILEAPAVGLPAVDVGDRQRGRRREGYVLEVPAEASATSAALRLALEPATRAAVVAARPRLADGRVGERVADIIAAWQPPVPPRKRPIVLRS